MCLNCYILTDQTLKHWRSTTNYGVQIQYPRFNDLPAAERQQLLRETSRMCPSFPNFRSITPRRISGT
jgi:hypothetical protein